MVQSVSKRSRIAEVLACVGLALWVLSFAMSLRARVSLAGVAFVAGLVLILCAILIDKPYRLLRKPRINWSLNGEPLPAVQHHQAAATDIATEIGRRLGVLASRAAQERYMVGATRDAYLLIDEAVEDALGVTDARVVQRMDPRTKAAVGRFLRVLRAEVRHLNALPQLPGDL